MDKNCSRATIVPYEKKRARRQENWREGEWKGREATRRKKKSHARQNTNRDTVIEREITSKQQHADMEIDVDPYKSGPEIQVPSQGDICPICGKKQKRANVVNK